jgi:uncharacterized SAM-binding protein YcdF (DUF218 family)
MNRNKSVRRILLIITTVTLVFFVFNGIKIFCYSTKYYETHSDVAIILGAGTKGDKLSPVYRERVNHGIYLFESRVVDKIIITGGYGEGANHADSEIARQYALDHNIPEDAIFIETKSRYTIENLIESKKIMDSLNFHTALIVSDPLHMKRAVDLALHQKIKCKPSPTPTTMYRSFFPITRSLFYETFYYSMGKIVGKN